MGDVSDINNYQFCEQIGHGAYADVFHGIHKITQQDVAIKVINLDTITEDDEICLVREVTALLQVDHPNIVYTFEYILNENRLYIISEYINGGMILTKVNDMHGLSESQARSYFNDVLSAINYLHRSRLICHRDIKLQNILISKTGSAKLIDFGFCNSNNFLRSFNSFVGTPGFTAPEVVDGVDYDNSCDIFSLGICLYAMVVGKVPIDLQNKNSKLIRDQVNAIEYPPTMSPLLVELIKKMVNPNPKLRIKLEEIIRHPWVRMENFRQDRYEVRKCPIDLGAITSIDELTNVRRKPQVIIAKNILHYIGSLGYDVHKIQNDVQRGEITPESAAFWIAVKNNIAPPDECHKVKKCFCTSLPISANGHTMKDKSRQRLPQLRIPHPNGPISQRNITPTGTYTKRLRF
ncbi:AGC family protein kinase [Trichomonas vaginalis G3]|uniref:AGC family protein kinase n=1 Tax=Trichomonas vaginalis (strain ATCC PRA-98 / G3) TaxID=412133 RepID=A2EX44_TRIV3|nr:protein serine/threonine kinase protein [Trichomonas vaginalis G3]EAY02764.1 AGC family protein kinase [Trichomonas vaginalis G3]KAI5500598.1 protein serine/threonine kinase protein [Trichomonas vaginalis G3]|eukprot:XP_001314987.1 AGC family protein kinase [Trichomonas vaginalis G3]